MKKGLVIIAILIIGAAAGAIWYYYTHPKTQPIPPIQQVQPEQTVQSEQPEQSVEDTIIDQQEDSLLQAHKNQRPIETNKKVVYEPEKVANPLLVGQWIEDGTEHYKVYLDDACDEESYFWGKEWDESQGVYEEDLTYHGNGWFKWSKTHNELIEIYTSEQGNMVIPTQYHICQLNDSVYIYQSSRTFLYHKIKL